MSTNDFRAASGLTSWPADGRPPWEIRSGYIHRDEDGDEVTTTVRRRRRWGLFPGRRGDGAGPAAVTARPAEGRAPRQRGTRLIWGSVTLLALLAGVAFYVSYAAQFGFVFAVKNLASVAAAEAAIPDAGMAICAMLALAMAVQGRSAKAARVCVVGFAALSAVMNYEAANSYSAHSVTVYVMPPVAFAVCTDLVISVVRRFYFGVEDSASPWRPLGRLVLGVFRGAGLLALYALRFCLDRKETWRGLRRVVLNAAPLPAEPPAGVPQAVFQPAACERPGLWATPGYGPPACGKPLPCPDHPATGGVPAANGTGRRGSKKARLLELYRAHEHHGDRSKVSPVAAELGPQAGLDPSAARTYLYRYVDALAAQS